MTARELRIHERIQQDYTYVKNLGYEVFGVFLQGSQNYELDYEGSDIDTKCIILPSVDDLVLNKQPISTTLILEDNSHIDLKDIRLMWQLFKKQNINYIEILFTDFYFVPVEYHQFWLEMRKINEDIARIDNYAAVNYLVGIVLQKYAALCHPYPTLKTKIDKYGYDNKQLHHMFRCKDFLTRFITGVSYKDCLIPLDRDFLIEVKADYKYTLSEAKTQAEAIVNSVQLIKQQYFENNVRVTNGNTSTKIDTILVNILKAAWKTFN